MRVTLQPVRGPGDFHHLQQLDGARPGDVLGHGKKLAQRLFGLFVEALHHGELQPVLTEGDYPFQAAAFFCQVLRASGGDRR